MNIFIRITNIFRSLILTRCLRYQRSISLYRVTNALINLISIIINLCRLIILDRTSSILYTMIFHDWSSEYLY